MQLDIANILDKYHAGNQQARYILICALANLETTDEKMLQEHYGHYLFTCINETKEQ